MDREKKKSREKNPVTGGKAMKKKIFFLLTALICLLMITAEDTTAYLMDAEEKVNTFVIGNNEITIEELFDPPQKGQTTVKKPVIKNIGMTDCYVRARILLSDSRAADYFSYEKDPSFGFQENVWDEAEDGWLYYQPVLKIGETTAPLFTHIRLSDSIPDLFLGFRIDVVCESVQSEGFQNSQEAFSALEGGQT